MTQAFVKSIEAFIQRDAVDNAAADQSSTGCDRPAKDELQAHSPIATNATTVCLMQVVIIYLLTGKAAP